MLKPYTIEYIYSGGANLQKITVFETTKDKALNKFYNALSLEGKFRMFTEVRRVYN